MDSFRERMGGRYERAERGGARGDRYERSAEDRYERAPRRESGVGIEAISSAIDKSNKDQLEVILDMFDDAKADRLESERAIINAISQGAASRGQAMPTNMAAAPGAANNSISAEQFERNVNEIKGGLGEVLARVADMNQAQQAAGSNSDEEILTAIGDNRSLLNMIRQDILNVRSNDESEEEDNTDSDALTIEAADKYYNDLEEHIHKESVKCYKNVQAALGDQTAEASAKVLKAVSGTKIMAIVSLVLNVVTLGALAYVIITLSSL